MSSLFNAVSTYLEASEPLPLYGTRPKDSEPLPVYSVNGTCSKASEVVRLEVDRVEKEFLKEHIRVKVTEKDDLHSDSGISCVGTKSDDSKKAKAEDKDEVRLGADMQAKSRPLDNIKRIRKERAKNVDINSIKVVMPDMSEFLSRLEEKPDDIHTYSKVGSIKMEMLNLRARLRKLEKEVLSEVEKEVNNFKPVKEEVKDVDSDVYSSESSVQDLTDSLITNESTSVGTSVSDEAALPKKVDNDYSVTVKVDDLVPDANKVDKSIPVEKEVKHTSQWRTNLPIRLAGVKAVEPAAKGDEPVSSHLEKRRAYLQLTPPAKPSTHSPLPRSSLMPPSQQKPSRSFFEWRERGKKAGVPKYFSEVEIEKKYREIIREAKNENLFHTIDWDDKEIPQVTLMKKFVDYLLESYDKALPKLRDFQDVINQTLSKSSIQERGFNNVAKTYVDIVDSIVDSGHVWEHNLHILTAATKSGKMKARETSEAAAPMSKKTRMSSTEEAMMPTCFSPSLPQGGSYIGNWPLSEAPGSIEVKPAGNCPACGRSLGNCELEKC